MAGSLADRVKEAAKEQGMSLTALAERLGVDRSAFSTRLNADRIEEPELLEIARLVKRRPEWLRYGVRGGFAEGVRWAVQQMRSFADVILDHEREGDVDVAALWPEAPRPTDKARGRGHKAVG